MALKEELRTQGDFLFKHRSFLPVPILVGALLVYLARINDANQNNVDGYYDVICIAVTVMGLIIRMITIGYTADNTSGRNTTEGQIADEINTTGLYSTCRHPLYLGNFFMWLGITMFTANAWFIVAIVLAYWLYYERIMYAEEAFLREKYGEKYSNWANSIPAFIPKISLWTKPKYSFSLIKVIRQEKSGILNMCVVIYFFLSIRNYFKNGDFLSFNTYWFWILIFGISWYILIKSIEKTSSLLTIDRA